MKKLFVVLLFAISANVFAAEDFTLCEHEVLTSPFPDEVVAVSQTINNNGLNSLRLEVHYESLTPDRAKGPATYAIQAVVEEEISPGTRTPVAYQFSGMNNTESAPKRIVDLSPGLVIDVGIDNVIYAGGKAIARISRPEGHLPDKFRVQLIATDYGSTAPLIGATISAYGRKYNQ